MSSLTNLKEENMKQLLVIFAALGFLGSAVAGEPAKKDEKKAEAKKDEKKAEAKK
jgi:outer membrane protein assembly factor BamE (lipoprotein component of BamABCDE complex)